MEKKEAKAYKITKVNAVDSGINVGFPLDYLVTQGDDVAYFRNLEFSQKVAAALNFFDTLMLALAAHQEQIPLLPPKVTERTDNFAEYIIAGSWISKIGYDTEKQKLRVHKYDDNIITHFNVPFDLVQEFINSKSAGVFYNANIRGKYLSEYSKERQ